MASPPSRARTRWWRWPCPDTRVRVRAGRAFFGVLVDLDQALGVRKRRRAEDRGVDDAEDRRVGADPQAQKQDGGDAEPPVAQQSPGGVPRLADERVPYGGAACAASLSLVAHARLSYRLPR